MTYLFCLNQITNDEKALPTTGQTSSISLTADFLESFAEKVISKYKASLELAPNQSLKSPLLVEQCTQMESIEITPPIKVIETNNFSKITEIPVEETYPETKTHEIKIKTDCIKDFISTATQTNPKILINSVEEITPKEVIEELELLSSKTDLRCHSKEFSQDISKPEPELSSHCPTEMPQSQQDEQEKEPDNADSRSEMHHEDLVGFHTYYCVPMFFIRLASDSAFPILF